MNNEEIQSLISQLKGVGLKEEEIMDTFYDAFKDGEMSREDLEALAEAMGYELTDDFKNEPSPDPIAASKDGEEVEKADLEEAKEIQPGESKEEFKDKIDEMKSEEKPVEGEEKVEEETSEEKEEESVEDESEEDEEEKDWQEAQKLLKA